MPTLRSDKIFALFCDGLAEAMAEHRDGDEAMRHAIQWVYTVGHAHGYETAAERAEESGFDSIGAALRAFREPGK